MSEGINNKEIMGTTNSKKTTVKKTSLKKKITTPVDITIQKYDDIEGKFLLVKVGTDSRPATGEDIKEIENKLVDLLEENNVNCLAFVTHHAVEFEIIGKLK